MKEVIKSVKEAEAAAANKKAEAEAEAEKILAASRARANEILKKSEEACKSFRETAIREAELRVEKEAERALQESQEKDIKFADALLKDTTSVVSQIVRRVTDGDSRHA